MGKLRSVNTHFWSDNYIIDLEPKYKLLFLYLLTNERTNMLGIYELHIKKISFDTGLDDEPITKGFKAFHKDKKASYIDGYVCMHNFTKHQSYNDNMRKSALNDYNELPLTIKKQPFCEPILKGLKPFPKGYEPITEYEVEVETEYEKEREGESDSGTCYSFKDFWKDYNKPVEETKSHQLWAGINEGDREAIKEFIPKYKKYEPEAQFRKNPVNFLMDRAWENEFIVSQVKNGKTSSNGKVLYTYDEMLDVVDKGKYRQDQFKICDDKKDKQGNPMRELCL